MSTTTFACPRLCLALAVLLCLGACGGGGGSSSDAGTPPPPVQAAKLPVIGAQAADTVAPVGTKVTFSVAATGDAPLSYQWQRNGADLAGATGAQLTLTAVQFADSGSKWSVVVRNNAGSVTSAQANLTVTGSSLLAGSLLAKNFTNGQLVGIAQDASGDTYLLDRGLETALTKVSPQGVATSFPLAPSGVNAALYQPTGMARDAAGNFYVIGPGCVIHKIDSAGVLTAWAGGNAGCGHDDGIANVASFQNISALTVDANGNVFVAQEATIRKITPAGVVTTMAGVANAYASLDGTGNAARFGNMNSMTADATGNVYVTDTGIGGHAIRKMTAGGVVTTLAGGAGYGAQDGQGSNASFGTLSGLVADAAGNLYVGDQGNHTIRKITPDGSVTTFAGQSTTLSPSDTSPLDGPAATATFREPVAITIDTAGNLFVAESSPGLAFNALRKISVDRVVTTITGTLAGRGAVDGQGAAARFALPRGLTVDASGQVWVADTGNQLIRQISATGAVTTLAGATGMARLNETGDGKGTLARFFQPVAIAVDASGIAFVADGVHNTVRKVLPDGTATTLAGQVSRYGAVDGPGASAIFAGLTGLTIDRTGMMYVTDMGAVRRVDPGSGEVTLVAGQLGPFADGTADGAGVAARFGYLTAIAADSAGNLYVVDARNNNVRKITPAGTVTTLAGTAGVTGSADGQGGAASFNRPTGIAVDKAGNVYVADTDNNLVRRITPAGLVSTVAGRQGSNGTVLGNLSNPLSQPAGLAFDANGILYVCANNGIVQLHL